MGRGRASAYRFLFAPVQIGAIAWLAANEHRVSRIKHGLVVSCVGDGGGPTYKKSRQGNASIDRAMVHVLQHRLAVRPFLTFPPTVTMSASSAHPASTCPSGYLAESVRNFPEYHTSADDLDFIKPEYLTSSYLAISAALSILENDCPLEHVAKMRATIGPSRPL